MNERKKIVNMKKKKNCWIDFGTRSLIQLTSEGCCYSFRKKGKRRGSVHVVEDCLVLLFERGYFRIIVIRKRSWVIVTYSVKFLVTETEKRLKIIVIGSHSGTKNEICVSLVYSGNVNEILFPFPLYTRETQISFFVPGVIVTLLNLKWMRLKIIVIKNHRL
jgi:hypothetical protein